MTGIILSGGKSSRMGGQNKAFLNIDGERLIDRNVRIFKSLFDEVIIVTNSPLDYIDQDVQLITDIVKGKGALGGIYTGLFYADTGHVFAVACDMPFLSRELISYMMRETGTHDIVVPFLKDGYQPLHAVYSVKCKKEIEKQLEKEDLKVSSFYRKFRLRKITEEEIEPFDPDGKIFFNINTGTDLEQARRI